jgi:hypothetical protein
VASMGSFDSAETHREIAPLEVSSTDHRSLSPTCQQCSFHHFASIGSPLLSCSCHLLATVAHYLVNSLLVLLAMRPI